MHQNGIPVQQDNAESRDMESKYQQSRGASSNANHDLDSTSQRYEKITNQPDQVQGAAQRSGFYSIGNTLTINCSSEKDLEILWDFLMRAKSGQQSSLAKDATGSMHLQCGAAPNQ